MPTLALVGPGRAGMSLALAGQRADVTVVAVAGRDPARTAAAAKRLGSRAFSVADVARGADLVLLAVPDAAIGAVAAATATGLEAGALVLHCSGARTLAVFDALVGLRSDVQVGSLHPLQTLSGAQPERLRGAFAAVEGPESVVALARNLGLRPMRVAPEQRAVYHAAATIASNHLVALLGHVARVAHEAGVPFDAFLPLIETTVASVAEHGAASALTGPVARGDFETVAGHLDALPADERAAYRSLAEEARRLANRADDDAIRTLLSEGAA
jgi:predicted short-subunit dehydrogenase-like oxidoreductase (DUF2520 family)